MSSDVLALTTERKPRDLRALTQTKFSRALKGAKKAGKHVSSAIILPDGSIKLDFSDLAVDPKSASDQKNEWDAVK